MDTVGDMLIRIKNAQIRHHESVVLPYSSMKLNIAKLLQKEGYVESVKMVKDKKLDNLLIGLSYNSDATPKVSAVKRVSKPGRRVYAGWQKLPVVLNGMGIAIVSTSKGIMTARQAKKEKLGGEIICEMY